MYLRLSTGLRQVTGHLLLVVCLLSPGATWLGCKSSPLPASPPDGSIPPPSPEIAKIYTESQELARANEWKKCVGLLAKVLPETKNPEQQEKVLLLLSEGYGQLKRYEDANEMYDLYLKAFPKTSHLDEVIEQKYKIGFKFLEGAKTSLWGLYIIPARDKGLAIIKDMFKNYPYAKCSAHYQLKLADHFYQKKMYAEARSEYELFIQTYPKHEAAPRAQFRLADSYLQEYQGPEYDKAMLEKAKISFLTYLKKYPEDEWIEQGNQKVKEIASREAEREYLTGCYYLSTGQKAAAKIYFDSLIKNYSETSWAKKAREINE